MHEGCEGLVPALQCRRLARKAYTQHVARGVARVL